MHGAHGRFNRTQWVLDGSTRLVDIHGRTESEAEEEAELPWIRPVYREEDEGDVVEHASLKPTWLLRFFNYWGSRWGVSKTHPKEKDEGHREETRDRAKSTSVAASLIKRLGGTMRCCQSKRRRGTARGYGRRRSGVGGGAGERLLTWGFNVRRSFPCLR